MEENMDYDYHYDREEHNNQAPQPPATNGLSNAALICGIISLCTMCCFYLSIPLAGLSILFALLSKGYDSKMNPQARTAAILAALAISISAGLIISTLATGNVQKTIQQYYKYYDEFELPFDSDSHL